MSLFEMSIAAAVMIVLILALRLLAIGELPKTTFLILWGLVIIRLLVPFSLPAKFSAYSLAEGITHSGEISDNISLSQLLSNGNAAINQAEPNMSIPIHFIIYIIGFTLILTGFAASYIVCLRKFRFSFPVESEYIDNWLMEHKSKRKIRFRMCDCISSPLTYGIIKPVILLPSDMDLNSTKQLDYIFMHEYLHIRRCDFLLKFFTVIAVMVHWFNPFVWAMFFMLQRDIELSCDEYVVRKSGLNSRADYAKTLISMAEKQAHPFPLYNQFSMNVAKERITAIMKTKSRTAFTSAISVVLVMVLACGFMTSAYAENEDMNAKGIELQWTWPAESTKVSAKFGYKDGPGRKIFSDHIGIACKPNENIYSALDGVVRDIGFNPKAGNYIVIESNENVSTMYSHLSQINVELNQKLSAGDKIGSAGKTGMATGCHLAFGVFINGQAVDPMQYYE